ncbi:carbohydrate-binding module family 48 protein [Seiridium cupressi]
MSKRPFIFSPAQHRQARATHLIGDATPQARYLDLTGLSVAFTFRDHPASEVYVTGTFDGWKKTEQLEKIGEHFEKQVQLSDASKKIYYKFVVDGNWVTDHTAPKETDESGNENNVLTPERIVTEAPATTAIMNSAAPDSTTAALAAGAPLEKKEEKEYKTEGLPGLFPETPAADLNKEFSINPLPAAPGAVNPVTLTPGEKIPEHIAAESTSSNVRLDPASYEKADELPGGVAAFSSAAPTSTTAELAAGAPIETKVPAVVKDSQEKAHFDPEASAVPEEVQEKAALEKELLDRVKEAPSTSEGTAGKGTEKTENTVSAGEAAASVAAAATALGGAALAGAVAATNLAVDKGTVAASSAQESATQAATNLPESVKAQLPESVQNAIGTTAKETTIEETAPAVPVEVKESFAEAGKSPEAATSASAVEDKAAVETELLKEVKLAPAVGEESKKIEPKTEPTPEVAISDLKTEPKAEPVSTSADKTVPEIKTETAPTTTAANGTGAQTVAAEPATPAKSTASSSKAAESPATTEKKKKNRISAFFGKLKEKSKK